MAESLVLKGNKYSMKIVAEKKTEGRTSRGDHYSSDTEYAIAYWKGGGEIKDKTARKSRLFEIKSREYNESRIAFPPLAEAIIRFGFRRFSWSYGEIEWRPVIKDEKRLIDLVLKQIFSEIEKAEAANRKKYPLPKITPDPLDVRDMVEMGLIEEDRRFRLGITYDHNETAAFSTRLSLPRNSLLLTKEMIKMCHAVNNDSRDKAEDNITEPIDVELITIQTSNPGLDACVSEVSGKAMTLRNDLPGNRLEIGFSIPGLCVTQALPETNDSIEDAKLVLEFHESIVKRIIDITRRNRDKHPGLVPAQLELDLK